MEFRLRNNMSNVFANFSDYSGLFDKFEPNIIEKRYNGLIQRYNEFIVEQKIQNMVSLNKLSLQHAIMDYYSDIGRLKDYHNIELTNKIKVIAYESYWLWRRKPLQIIEGINDSKTKDTEVLFCNELFVYTSILSFLSEGITDERYASLKEQNHSSDIDSFFQTLFYYLKFRQCNPQVFELVILSFLAGKQFYEI